MVAVGLLWNNSGGIAVACQTALILVGAYLIGSWIFPRAWGARRR
jgi:hypothetical protein